MERPIDKQLTDVATRAGEPAQSLFGRRKMLKLSLLAGGGVLAAITGIKVIPRGFADYGTLQILSRYHADIAYAMAEAILPSRNGWPSVADTQLIQRMDEELFFLDPANSSDFKAVLMLLEMMPMTFGFFGRFTRLDAAQRLAFLKRCHEADDPMVNVAVNAPRSMLTYLYYGHETVWSKVGYDGPYAGLEQRLSEQREYYQVLRRRA